MSKGGCAQLSAGGAFSWSSRWLASILCCNSRQRGRSIFWIGFLGRLTNTTMPSQGCHRPSGIRSQLQGLAISQSRWLAENETWHDRSTLPAHFKPLWVGKSEPSDWRGQATGKTQTICDHLWPPSLDFTGIAGWGPKSGHKLSPCQPRVHKVTGCIVPWYASWVLPSVGPRLPGANHNVLLRYCF